MDSAIIGQLHWLLGNTGPRAHFLLLDALGDGRMNGSLYYDEETDCGCVLGHLAGPDGYIEDAVYDWRPAQNDREVAEWMRAAGELPT